MLRIIGHLVVTAFRAFFRILATAVISAALGVGAVTLVANHFTHWWPWPPDQVVAVALVGVGAVPAYSGG
jgi:hypothetical protein